MSGKGGRVAGGVRKQRRHKRPKVDQLTFDRHQWGGSRPGAGRKKSPDSGMPHDAREELEVRLPVLVTTKLLPGLGSLRRGAAYHAIALAFAEGREKEGFRVVHYSVMSNHLHLVVEADSRLRLSRGIQGLMIRMARALNRLWRRTGRVFADRYHDRILRTPRQVRNALGYVLNNARKHGLRLTAGMPDPFSTGDLFDGWNARFDDEPEGSTGLVARARTWLLQRGWRRHGLLPLDAAPVPS